MYPSLNEMPTPLGTIDSLLEEGDSSEKPQKVFVGHNLGHRIFLMQVPMHEFFQMSEVANDPGRDGETVAQRKLDPAHAHKLAVYILKGLVAAAISHRQIQKKEPLLALNLVMDQLGRQPYLALQPLVTNIRACSPAGVGFRAERITSKEDGTTVGFKAFFSQQHVLYVIDGQHRRFAMKLVFDFLDTVTRLRSYPKKGSLYTSDSDLVSNEELVVWQSCYDAARTHCTVAVEVHLGLMPEQERQLFHDLNNLGKKVERSLALKFDNSNPVNLFIKEQLMDRLGLDVSETDAREWKDDTGALAWKDAVAVNAILFLNKGNIGGATPPDVSLKVDVAIRFWEAVKAIPEFGENQAKEKTVAAQPVVLKALAKLTYDFAFSSRRGENAEGNLETLLSGLSDFNFSHDNPMWRYYEMTSSERIATGIDGLVDYLPEINDGVNRDLGSFQGGFMRFGSKHNDIFPILGDMIRWKLRLPSRHGVRASML